MCYSMISYFDVVRSCVTNKNHSSQFTHMRFVNKIILDSWRKQTELRHTECLPFEHLCKQLCDYNGSDLVLFCVSLARLSCCCCELSDIITSLASGVIGSWFSFSGPVFFSPMEMCSSGTTWHLSWGLYEIAW